MTYKAAVGHDNTAGYADLAPQPSCEGLNYEEWGDSDTGAYPIGKQTTELIYDGAIEPSEYEAILASLGLTAAESAAVTLYLPKDGRTFADFNCYVSRPKTIKYKHWYRDIRFPVVIVEEI